VRVEDIRVRREREGVWEGGVWGGAKERCEHERPGEDVKEPAREQFWEAGDS